MNILLFLLAFVTGMLVIAAMMGSFRKPVITNENMPGYSLMGFDYQGTYQKIGPSIKKIAELAKSKGIQPQIVAVYFDNPREVKDTDCRALAAIRVTPEIAALLQHESLSQLDIQSGPAWVGHWPGAALPTRIMGAIRVYPYLQKKITEEQIMHKVNFVYEVYEPKETIFVMQYNA
jgi:hypothetical protein